MSVRAGAVAAAGDRAPVGGADFAALLPDMARRLLGDPPRATAAEWRYGSHGSLSVHPQSGTWHDFEADAGGGALDLVMHLLQTDKAGALAWLVDARLIDPPAGPDARPAAPWRPGGTSTPPAPVVTPPAPKPAPTGDVARAILAAAVPADDTPARVYLARRFTWPLDGPPLPAAVRWLPPSAWERLPTWPGPDGRPRRLRPPVDGVSSLTPGAAPAARCGAVVFELARPGCAPDAVQIEAVTADGDRPAGRWRLTLGNAAGRVFEARNVPGGALWLVEGGCDALALVLTGAGGVVRAVGGTGYRLEAVTDPERRSVVIVPDGDVAGSVPAGKLREALRPAGRFCSVRYLPAGDVADLLAEWVAERAGIHAEALAVPVIDGPGYAPGPDRDEADARAWKDVLTAVASGARLIEYDSAPETDE